jgi:hypothetical protein
MEIATSAATRLPVKLALVDWLLADPIRGRLR